MPTQPQGCDQSTCPDCGKIAGPHIKVYGDIARRYYCTTGSYTFHAARGTFFETVRTDRHVLLHVVAM